MTSENRVFWLVWSPGGAAPPRYRHSSQRSAVAEAERLADLNPGWSFFVLRACEMRRSRGLERVTLVEDATRKEADLDLPF